MWHLLASHSVTYLGPMLHQSLPSVLGFLGGLSCSFPAKTSPRRTNQQRISFSGAAMAAPGREIYRNACNAVTSSIHLHFPGIWCCLCAYSIASRTRLRLDTQVGKRCWIDWIEVKWKAAWAAWGINNLHVDPRGLSATCMLTCHIKGLSHHRKQSGDMMLYDASSEV